MNPIVIRILKKKLLDTVNCREKQVGVETKRQLGVNRQFIGEGSKGKPYFIAIYNNKTARITCGLIGRKLKSFDLQDWEYTIQE